MNKLIPLFAILVLGLFIVLVNGPLKQPMTSAAVPSSTPQALAATPPRAAQQTEPSNPSPTTASSPTAPIANNAPPPRETEPAPSSTPAAAPTNATRVAAVSPSQSNSAPNPPSPTPSTAPDTGCAFKLPVRIMPLGDSITESGAGLQSYRYWLWHRLDRAGYAFEFVGSQYGVMGGEDLPADYDQRHEGHSGWTADMVLEHVMNWARAARPDIVLLHLGTNDLWTGQTIESTIQELGSIVDQLRAVNPRVHVLLAQIIPGAPDTGLNAIPYLNRQIPNLAAAKNTAESPVIVVNQYAEFDPVRDTIDGVHPNASGEQKLSEKWFARLQPLLEGCTKSR